MAVPILVSQLREEMQEDRLLLPVNPDCLSVQHLLKFRMLKPL